MSPELHGKAFNAGDPTEQARVMGEQVNEALQLAWDRGRRIDDLTAKRIALLIEPGSGPLHEFYKTGVISPSIEAELKAVCDTASGPQELWAAALDDYCRHRRRKEAIRGWADMELTE